MQYIQSNYTSTLEVKQSKFIAYLIPFEKFESTLKELRKQHPKARHFVTAYRYLNEHSQIDEASSDDGEPKGTSGKPVLMVIQGKDLINTAVIVVRYFGGTKLGTGGLLRAYSDVANNVLSEADCFTYVQEVACTIEFEYHDVRKVEYECRTLHVTIKTKEFGEKVTFELQAEQHKLDQLSSL